MSMTGRVLLGSSLSLTNCRKSHLVAQVVLITAALVSRLADSVGIKQRILTWDNHCSLKKNRTRTRTRTRTIFGYILSLFPFTM